MDFTVCFYKGDAVTFVNFGYFFNARFETRLNRLFGEKEGGRVGGEEGEISEAVGGSQQGEVQQHLHRMGGSTIYGGNSTPLQGGKGEREGRENSCNGLFRFTFKKYIEKQFSSMRGKTDTYAHESMILLKVTQTPTTTSGSAATTTVTMTTSDSTVTTSAGRQIST